MERGDFTWTRPEIEIWILCVDAALHRVHLWIAVAARNGLAGCNFDLFFDQVKIDDLFGYGVFYLDAGVHFHEVEVPVLIDQKLVEESPSPFMTPELREKMGEAAVKACTAIGYEGVGTVEFLVDKYRNFYFMEMNTRIQVEHTVTEEVIDFDLIKEQIKIAAGIPISGKNYFPEMHAIECRINAEDPFNDFRPSPGRITSFHSPKGHGVRVDTHVYGGYTIPPYYDSMIAKLIVRARTRDEAITKMERALDEFIVEGVKTTVPFHQRLMQNPDFRKGNFHTGFLNTWDFKNA